MKTITTMSFTLVEGHSFLQKINIFSRFLTPHSQSQIYSPKNVFRSQIPTNN